MCEAMYQRAEPRHKTWLPLISQQIRLRNILQVYLVNPSIIMDQEEGSASALYFTLHVSAMSAPFFTSERVIPTILTEWSDLQITSCSVNLSLLACIVRVWTGDGTALLSWGVHFKGLHHLGSREDWGPNILKENTLVFVTPFGCFTALSNLLNPQLKPQRFLTIKNSLESPMRTSYTLKKLSSLHHRQRSVLDEHDLSYKRRNEIELSGFNTSQNDSKVVHQLVMLSERLIHRCRLGEKKLRLKEEMEHVRLRVGFLNEEKVRCKDRIARLRKEATNIEEQTHGIFSTIHGFSDEKISLAHIKDKLMTKGQTMRNLRSGVFLRKKQLISELLQIYPLALVEGSKKFSINGVQLPNAEDYVTETGGQISVALGYTAHLTAMTAFFLDIPCRYPIRHFGSRSRIIDHITMQIPDKEREFPLYFKGKKDIYCAYAVYLLNKNISQLRWYCGLSTPDLRATLPNLVELLSSRLVIAGWPPNLGETLEIAQEITEDIVSQLFEDENDISLSLDKGLDKITASMNFGNNNEVAPSLDEGFSDENPGGNSVAVGDIKHGRGQERFLSGWKKKTYVETDDFDPKWLMDSMNLDFDVGRRFSFCNSTSTTTANSPTSVANRTAPDLVLLSSTDVAQDDERDTRRRRRIGVSQVDAPMFNLVEGQVTEGSSAGSPLQRINTPSKDIIRLELDIKEFERRKSRTHHRHSLSPSDMVDWRSDTESDGNKGMVHVQKLDTVCSGYHLQPPVTTTEQNVTTQTEVEMKVDTSAAKGNDETFQSEEDKKTADVDLSLLTRTEALLGGSASFNLLRRRLSTSEST